MTLVTNGMLGPLLITWGLTAGSSPAVTGFNNYIDPDAATAVSLTEETQEIDPDAATVFVGYFDPDAATVFK